MTHTCAYGTHCWATCLVVAVAWLLASSGLLMLTWNKVIAAYAKVKPAKYGQALLLLATICALLLPCALKRSRCGWGSHGACAHSGHCCGGMGKEDCPYARGEHPADSDEEPADKGAAKK